MYHLFGMPYSLNVWTYECASSLNPEFAVKVASGIPRICNWRVVAVKPKFGRFMSSIFSENACSNIVPTPNEVEALDLLDIQDAHTSGPSTTTVDAKKVQTKDNSGFENFSTSPPGHLFRRSLRVYGTSSPSPPKRRKKIDTSKTAVSEPKSSEQLRPQINQSFSMPDEAPTPVANDDASGQMPQHFFEGTMNEDASDKVQHNTNQSVPDPVTFDALVIYVSCCEITNRAPYFLIDEYIQWVTRGLLKSHANKKPSDDKYRARSSSLGFEMMDYVIAFPINKNWFYAMSQPKNCWTDQRTNWPYLDAYKDKQTGALLEPHHPFNVEYAQGIMQQECDSLDCGLNVATFAEFMSDQLVIPPDSDAYLSSYLRNRYTSLLWRYGSDKAKGGYISEIDDPPKPKGQLTKPTEEDFVNIV
uniref:Ulp1 protease family, C-terminal catalytic domain containing protein n=1 Tax=Solanum tuberosum TaxID=4113 RepID=M1DEQ7_SOLTU